MENTQRSHINSNNEKNPFVKCLYKSVNGFNDLNKIVGAIRLFSKIWLDSIAILCATWQTKRKKQQKHFEAVKKIKKIRTFWRRQ